MGNEDFEPAKTDEDIIMEIQEIEDNDDNYVTLLQNIPPNPKMFL